MKKIIMIILTAAIVMTIGGCSFLMGPDSAGENGDGSLSISFGIAGNSGEERALTRGSDLPAEILAGLRYNVVLTGPDGGERTETVTGGENLQLTAVALGAWRIGAKAYQGDILAGTGSLDFTVAPGPNPVRVPMTINQGYFTVSIGTFSGGTVGADYAAAFPGTTITVTVSPAQGYQLKSGSLQVLQTSDDTSVPLTETGTAYTFTLPPADVTISAEFGPTSLGIIIEGPQDKTIGVTITRNGVPVPAAATAPVEMSFSAGESLTFTVDPGYTVGGGNLFWVVENLPTNLTGNSLTVDAKKYALKLYTLTVMIKEDGQWYSTNIAFKVVE
jgi:hypothetical protein